MDVIYTPPPPVQNPAFTSSLFPLVVVPATENTEARWSYYINNEKILVGRVEVKVNRKGVKKLTCKCDGIWSYGKFLSGAYLTDIGIRATKVGQEIKRQAGV